MKPLQAVILTYGCQMNKHDSELMGGLLSGIGYQIYYSLIPDPDIIILNTCAVRQNAENRVLGRISELKKFKDKNPDTILGITGCVAQEHKKSLLKKCPYVDLVVGPADIHKIAWIIQHIINNKIPVSAVSENKRVLNHTFPHKRENNISAWVSIISGCNNFCSYCIVPYVRNREISRSPEDILTEIKSLLDSGYKEIFLLGQNVNSYGNDLDETVTFPGLLEKIDQLPGDFWIRFVTSHPKDLSDGLINIMKNSQKICNHLHLPVQSGSNKILKLMNRGYTREHYISLINKIRNNIPDIAITTDVIVGFPQETDEDFELTFELFRKIRFDSAYIFKYSRRPGTKAAELPGTVDVPVLKERHKKLLDYQIKVSEENNKKYIGYSGIVLPESISPKNREHLQGRVQQNKVIIFPAPEKLIGQFVKVNITDAGSWTLFGKIKTLIVY